MRREKCCVGVDKSLLFLDTGGLDGRVIGNCRRSANDSNEKGERLMYDMANFKEAEDPGQGAPKAMDAFWAFDKAALADGVVPKKYKELIALGVALTTQCPYCLEIHRGNAVAAERRRRSLRRRRWWLLRCVLGLRLRMLRT